MVRDIKDVDWAVITAQVRNPRRAQRHRVRFRPNFVLTDLDLRSRLLELRAPPPPSTYCS